MKARPWQTLRAPAADDTDEGTRGEAPRRRVLRTEHVGPFVVTPCDDGTVWVRGDPPHHELREWSPAAALTLERARHLVQAIDAADDRTTRLGLARVVALRYADDPSTPALLGWINRRRQQLAAPSCLSPPPSFR